MDHDATRFIDDIPAHYDLGLGPHLFIDYGVDLAHRAAATGPTRVLEVAAGTGIVTRLLRDALPTSTFLVASDLNSAMLDIARRKFSAGEAIAFQRADATALPFEDDGFDAVVCQFGVMFFADKSKGYREAYRTLAPGGHYFFNVWDSQKFNPFARIAHDTIGSFFPDDAPTFFSVPFGYHRIDDIKTSLIDAGFEDVSMHVLRLAKTIPEAGSFAEGLILGNPVVEEIRARGTVEPEAIVDAVTTALHRAFGGDPLRMPLQAIVFRARKP